MKRKFTLLLCLMMFMTFCAAVMSGCGSKRDENTIRMMVVWNGLSFLNPDDQAHNAVAEVIRKKTGITLEVEFCDTNETQKLTQVFSMGSDMPDVIMCPFWGGTAGEAGVIKNAAKSGLLLPFDDYIDLAPNAKGNFTEGVAKQFVEQELKSKDFGGKNYVMPIHCPASSEDTPNWGYTVFGRKDILSDLNVDPSSINTSEDVYALAKKIKAGSYKDINGNAVIPAGNWQNGWEYSVFVNSYRYRQLTPVYEAVEGESLKWMSSTEELKSEVKFMRKMISEGLYDREAFTHSDTRARQKHINGSIGLTGAHYTQIRNILKDTLYKAHPEMEYVPLGPIYDAAGNPYMADTYGFNGDAGGASIIMTQSCENPEEVMRYLNYINSDEGRLLTYLGIEGEDWTRDESGRPRMSDTFFERVEQDPEYGINRGIESIFIFGVSRLPRKDFRYAKEQESDEIQNQIDAWYPLVFAPDDGILATAWDTDFADYDRMVDVLAAMNYQNTVQAAYFADSDTAAINIIGKYNAAINKNGLIDNYLRFVKEKVDAARADDKKVLF